MAAEPIRIHRMSNEEFEAARDAHLQPVPCQRCGRVLMSPSSILRGYGQKCAWLQALDELSLPAHEHPLLMDAATFLKTEPGVWEIIGRNEATVGFIRQRKDAYWITLWGDKLDFDLDLSNAKKRALRILERMGR